LQTLIKFFCLTKLVKVNTNLLKVKILNLFNMKKLLFISLFLFWYLFSFAQDTIPKITKPNNQQNQITPPDQLNVPNNNQSTNPSQQVRPQEPNVPKPPNVEPYVPQQVNPSYQQTVPAQPNAPGQPSVPDQPGVQRENLNVQPAAPVQPNAPAQMSGTYQQTQPTSPNQEYNRINPQNGQGLGYQTMSDLPRIGNKVVRFTFIASPQITWMTSGSKFARNSKSRFGFAYGVEGDVFLASDRYSFLTGFVISSLGSTMEYTTPFRFSGSPDLLPANTKVEYYLRYIEIPLAIKLRSKDFNNMRFFAQFGLNTWMNIKAKASTSDGSFNKDAVNDEVRFFALGLNVGGGVEYDLGDKNSVTAGIVYSGSFNDATSNSTISDKTTINSLRIRLGFIF
jgi:hypothetical protein